MPASKRMQRTFHLNNAALSLGLDETTLKAMTHFESVTDALAKNELSWDDVPERCSSVTELMPGGPLGKLALKAARRNSGFQAVEAAFTDPALKLQLQTAYEQCLTIAPRNIRPSN